MNLKVTNKNISSIITILPQNEYGFQESIRSENLKRVERLQRVMGFDKRRRVKKETVVSDLMSYGMNYLFDNGLIEKEQIGAIVTTTLTPNYYAPNCSSLLHSVAGLPEDVICYDIPQGCAGYISGLFQSCMLLDKIVDKKVLLFTGEVFNRKYLENEPKTETPNFGGDAASITIIENCEQDNVWSFSFNANGKDGNVLLMPGGAFWHPMYVGEPMTFNDGGEMKHYLGTNMDGTGVFNFIQKEVPDMITDIVKYSNVEIEDLDMFLFHQPNRYILEKLAERMSVEKQKMPMNIVEKYGNSNSSTIPMVITDNCSQILKEEKKLCCLSGFGSGLSWGAIVMQLGNLKECKILQSPY